MYHFFLLLSLKNSQQHEFTSFLLLSGDVKLNPGPKRNSSTAFSICHRDLNSKSAHIYAKVFLLKAYIASLILFVYQKHTVILVSDVFRLFGRAVYWFRRPNSGAQKTLFKFSYFSCIPIKVDAGTSDFTMHNYYHNYFEMAQNMKMQTEEKNNETKRSKRKKKLSTRLFSFI